MKNFRLTLVFLMLISVVGTSYAEDFYFSTVNGNNNTLQQIQDQINSLNAGDRILLERGSRWDDAELILEGRNGTQSNPIAIEAYGTGPDPIINCYHDISGGFTSNNNMWTKSVSGFSTNDYHKKFHSKDIETDSPFQVWDYLNFLLINNELYSMGKYPNNNYLDFEVVSEDLKSWVVDNQASWSDNQWAGAQLRVCPAMDGGTRAQWVLESISISGSSANSLSLKAWSYFSGLNHTLLGPDNYGNKQKGFISNHPNACDIDGDWAYNLDTDILSVYYSGDLNNQSIEIPMKDYALHVKNASYISINGIEFRGGLLSTVRITTSNSININQSTIQYAPYAGLYIDHCDEVNVNNNQIKNSCSNGIVVKVTGNIEITNNEITDIGLWPSMGGDTEGTNFMGISIGGMLDNVDLIGNTIRNTGYSAIASGGSSDDGANIRIMNNNIYDPCSFLTDGAGIYFFDHYKGNQSDQRWIKNNLISCYVSNPDIQYTGNVLHQGIYLDGYCRWFEIEDNTIYGFPNGIYLHGGRYNTVQNNVIYDWGVPGSNKSAIIGCDAAYSHYESDYPVVNSTAYCNIINNIAVATSEGVSGFTWMFDGSFDDENNIVDNNTYYNQFSTTGNDVFKTITNWTPTNRSFSNWRSLTGHDVSSTLNNNGISYIGTTEEPARLIKVLYNTSETTNRTVNLYDLQFKDVNNNTITGSVDITPRTSKILFYELGSGTMSNLDLIDPIGEGSGSSNSAPYATNVNIVAPISDPGVAVFGEYTYNDSNGDLEATSEYQWYITDNVVNPDYTPISGETTTSYIIKPEDGGRYICFGITPVAQTGIQYGSEVYSEWMNISVSGNQYTLTINTVGAGGVNHLPTAIYDEGTELDVTATPAQGWIFTGWTGDIVSTDNPLDIIMDQDYNIAANFIEDSFEEKYIYVNFGHPNYSASAPWNDIKQFPNAGSGFSNLKYDDNGDSGIDLTFLDSWDGQELYGKYTTEFPWPVGYEEYIAYNSTPRRIQLSDLDINSTYDISIYASRGGRTSITRFTVGSVSHDIATEFNETETADFSNVNPDAEGKIIITCEAIEQFGHINAMVITEKSVSGNLPPIATADSYEVQPMGALTISSANGVLANDSDPESTNLTAHLVSTTTYGNLTMNADGSFVYECETSESVTDVFTYYVTDGFGLQSEPVEVHISVAYGYELVLEAQINFNAGSHTDEAGWFNIPWGGPNSTTSLWEDVTLTNVSGSMIGTRGDVSGNMFPYNVADSYHYTANNVERAFRLENVPVNRIYLFKFFGSREYVSSGTDRTTVYKVYEPQMSVPSYTDSLNAHQNTSNTVNIDGIFPQGAERTIEFSFKQGENSLYGYLNALEIYSRPIPGCDCGKRVESLSDTHRSSISIYPNPVTDELTISHLSGQSTVRIYNVLGELKDEFEINERSEMKISMNEYNSGTYIVHIYSEASSDAVTKIISKK